MSKTFRLSRDRAAWSQQFKPKTLSGSPLVANAAVEVWYRERLLRLVDTMHTSAAKELVRLFTTVGDPGYSEDASLSSQSRIAMSKLRSTWLSLFDRKAKNLAEGMLTRANKANAASTHGSLKELSGGMSIKTDFISGALQERLKAAIADNVSLMRSLAADSMTKLEGAVMRSITSGNGLADLVPATEEISGHCRARAHRIARDQTRKANAFIGQQRLMDAGIQYFRWIHTGRSKEPRDYHVSMHGKIYRLDDPPVIDPKTMERGMPGQLLHCECRAEPVIVLEEGDKVEA